MEALVLISFGLFLQVAPEQCIYHGCFYKNADRTNKFINASEKCFAPTNDCFWKDPSDVKNGVKTRSHAKNKPKVTLRDCNRYCDKKLVNFSISK